MIFAIENVANDLTAVKHRVVGRVAQWQLVLELVRRDQHVDGTDVEVVNLVVSKGHKALHGIARSYCKVFSNMNGACDVHQVLL